MITLLIILTVAYIAVLIAVAVTKGCPDCGLFACKTCNDIYAKIDDELREKGL